MLLFTAGGPRSVASGDVLCVYRAGGRDGRYPHCTLVLLGGSEVSGAILDEALDALEADPDSSDLAA
jgi:hypothetical protein